MTFEEQASGASMSIGGTTWVTTALADQRPWRNPEATVCHQGAAHRRRPIWALSAPIASAPRTCRRQRAMTTSPQASLPAAGAWRARWRVDDKKAPPSRPGGRFAYRFCARDLQLVQAPEAGTQQRSR